MESGKGERGNKIRVKARAATKRQATMQNVRFSKSNEREKCINGGWEIIFGKFKAQRGMQETESRGQWISYKRTRDRRFST